MKRLGKFFLMLSLVFVISSCNEKQQNIATEKKIIVVLGANELIS